MNRMWLIIVLGLAFSLLAVLKTHEVNMLQPFMKGERSLQLNNFAKARKNLATEQLDLLELWESILTGRSAPLSRETKKLYQDLGLKHVFTPSGFHLTAVLSPFLKLSSSVNFHFGLLLLLGVLLHFVPGMSALKRMIVIKGTQKACGMHAGFALALYCDILLGTFQTYPLSFAYSFLFLGIIYSGLSSIGLAFWFFIGQTMISFFQSSLISPLLLLWSPVFNLAFALAMPFLFLLALPLWSWQLKTGLFILKWLQKLILLSSSTLTWFPLWEINSWTIILLVFFIFRRKKSFLLALALMSHSLNCDLNKAPRPTVNEYRPTGKLIKTTNGLANFTDGQCRIRMIEGHLWENCRPRKFRK